MAAFSTTNGFKKYGIVAKGVFPSPSRKSCNEISLGPGNNSAIDDNDFEEAAGPGICGGSGSSMVR
jgi:hypothetical protein